MMAGPEAEFFLFHRDANGEAIPTTHDTGGYFDLSPRDLGEEARRDITLVLEAMGLEVEAAHHEVAPGQHEIDFKYGRGRGHRRCRRDLPLRGQKGGPDARPPRHLHAETAGRGQRLRHARPPVVVHRRWRERLLRCRMATGSCQRSAAPTSAVSSNTPAPTSR